MTKREIKAFNDGCLIQRRADGVYVRHPELSAEFAGPFHDALAALRFYRLIFCVQ